MENFKALLKDKGINLNKQKAPPRFWTENLTSERCQFIPSYQVNLMQAQYTYNKGCFVVCLKLDKSILRFIGKNKGYLRQ